MRILTASAAAVLCGAMACACFGEIPGKINYQGKVTDPSGKLVADGNYSMGFKLFDAPTGGTEKWSESRGGVGVSGGLCSVLLGSTNDLTAVFQENDSLYLEIAIAGETLSPRQEIAAAGYAVRSAMAEGLSAAGTVSLLESIYPVGSIYLSVVSTNPATLLGFGTWTAFAAGRTIVGINAGDADFNVVEETGGAKTHTLTGTEMPSHTHTQNAHSHTFSPATLYTNSAPTDWGTRYGAPEIAVDYDRTPSIGSATATNQNTGGGQSHNNLQPYIVVYMWKRTA